MLCNYTISWRSIQKSDLSQADFFLLLSIYHANGMTKIPDHDVLIKKRFIFEMDGKVYVMDKTKTEAFFKTVMKEISSEASSAEYIALLTPKLQELFPKGLKPGTNQYWRGSKAIVSQKLNTFFKKYGFFDEDIIIEAIQKYVTSYGSNTKLMRTLPYLIEKNDESDLLQIIENFDDIGQVKDNKGFIDDLPLIETTTLV